MECCESGEQVDDVTEAFDKKQGKTGIFMQTDLTQHDLDCLQCEVIIFKSQVKER